MKWTGIYLIGLCYFGWRPCRRALENGYSGQHRCGMDIDRSSNRNRHWHHARSF